MKILYDIVMLFFEMSQALSTRQYFRPKIFEICENNFFVAKLIRFEEEFHKTLGNFNENSHRLYDVYFVPNTESSL